MNESAKVLIFWDTNIKILFGGKFFVVIFQKRFNFAENLIMELALFEIEKTTKGGKALYNFLRNSNHARLITKKRKNKNEYTFFDLNDITKKAFEDAENGNTIKTNDLKDLFKQLEI